MIQHGHAQAPKASFVVGLAFFCLLSGSALFAESPLIADAKKAIKAKEDSQAAALLSDFLRSSSNSSEASEARFLLGQIQARQHRIDDALRNFGVIIASARGTEWAARSLEETAKLYEMRRNPMGAKRARKELLRDYPQSTAAAPLLWQQLTDQFKSADYAKATALIETYLANPYAKNAAQARRMRETGLQALEGKTAEAESLRAKQLIERAEALFERRLYARALEAFEQVRKETGSAEPDFLFP